MSHATLWDNNAASKGMTVRPGGEAPQIGDIAHWEGNDANPMQGYGHVAIVTSTNPLTVDEFNGSGDGNYRTRTNPAGIDHFIAVPGLSGSLPPTSYSQIPEGQEFHDGGYVYTKVGGSAWPIKAKNEWTAADTAVWGNEPTGPVSTAEIHDHEAGFGGATAHPPRYGTAVYELGSNGQQYYFVKGERQAIAVQGSRC
jgi:hypothetical protein